MSRIFIEIHTDSSGRGAGGNEIVPSGWYDTEEAIETLLSAIALICDGREDIQELVLWKRLYPAMLKIAHTWNEAHNQEHGHE